MNFVTTDFFPLSFPPSRFPGRPGPGLTPSSTLIDAGEGSVGASSVGASKVAASSAVALGCFDGVHKGHFALLLAARKAANKRGLPLTVWSMTGKPCQTAGLLCTEEERRALLLRSGADSVVFAPFRTVHTLSCGEFVREILCGNLGAVTAFCGENFRFGAGGAGGADDLRALLAACGGETVVLPLLRQAPLGRETTAFSETYPPVSSTRIKALLSAGAPAQAATLLGRYFAVTGEVLHGRALGRTLGFPTANLRFPRELTVPKMGVYFGRAFLGGGEAFPAVCNLGVRPTVESAGELLLECCLLSFDGMLYGEMLRVELREFLRPEIPFSSRDALQAQVLRDLAAGRRMAALEDTAAR